MYSRNSSFTGISNGVLKVRLEQAQCVERLRVAGISNGVLKDVEPDAQLLPADVDLHLQWSIESSVQWISGLSWSGHFASPMEY